MIALRRRLHASGLGFEEHATSDLVAGFLTTWGYRVTREPAARAWSAR